MNPFEQTPNIPPKNETFEARTKFQSQLNELLLSGAPLREIADILGAQQYVEGRVGEGVRFNVQAFADAQFGKEEKRESLRVQGEAVDRPRKPLRLPEKFLKLPRTILPPGEGEVVTGSGEGFEEKKIIPRNQALIRLLTELEEPYMVVSGTNTREMMRGEIYRIFLLPNKQKLVFVNDEEGNATFVVYSATAGEWRQYAAMTKDQLKEVSGGKVEVVMYPGTLEEWKVRMREAVIREVTPTTEVHQESIEGSQEAMEELVTPRDVIVVDEPQKEEEQKSERAPEGWMTKTGVVNSLPKTGDKLVGKIADTFRGSHPEWFQKYLDKIGKPAEHFHPDLIIAIKDELAKRPPGAPEGWLSMRKLSSTVGKSEKFLAKITESFRETHPEWFQGYLDSSRKISEHLHPDLITKVLQETEKLPVKVPEGWMANAALARELEEGKKVVANTADMFRETHPEWFQNYLAAHGQVFEYYHPDLVRVIQEELEKRPGEAPEGWMTNNALAIDLGIHFDVISKVVDIFRETHPEWFREYTNLINGSVREHFHPDLVREIKAEVKRHPSEAPEGWITRPELARRSGKSEDFIHRIAENILRDYPEWIRKYSGIVGVSTYYHPDLTQKIREKIDTLPPEAPSGWKTQSAIARELRSTLYIIPKIADTFRDSHPEWFRKYLDKGKKVTEHLHPDLVVVIKEELDKRPPGAPEGWMTKTALAGQYNKKGPTVLRIAELFRSDHPEWFQKHSDNSGVSEYYHPDLVTKIKVNLDTRPDYAPSGWLTSAATSIALGIQTNRSLVLKVANSFRDSHPEWFKEYLDRAGKISEHYHPDLVVKIREALQK